MKSENSVLGTSEVPGGRITRARAAAFRASGAVLPLKPPIAKPEKKQLLRGKKTKRDENSYTAPTASFQNKKRAFLRDITNDCREKSLDYNNAARAQIKGAQKVRAGPSKVKVCPEKMAAESSDWAPAVSAVCELVLDDKKTEQVQEMALLESQESSLSFVVNENIPVPQDSESLLDGEISCNTVLFEKHAIRKDPEIICSTQHVKDEFCKDAGALSMDFVDIDSDHSNPQMCCLYSSDIYTNLRAAELLRRPLANFMETVQRDITHSMRGILIDWLVEVSDEYKIVPDTLFLTVYMIDRFLSQICIERQRLQLLGITCMLIASKYEEICAPRAEELCFITDNTYTKVEVLNMEIQVLNFLGFHLSVPTTKTFLRRFIRAAHTAYKVPPQALSHLANYFAELTLVEYSFLKFLPSAIAASAVFLARWTLEQSDHPWNRTLEHYTFYKASEIKTTVLAMHDLQLNSNNGQLNAIREKYKQPKFESVSSMTSPELLQSLFS